MASNLKVDIVRPTATNGSLALKGDSGGAATTNGVAIDSSGNTSITGTTTVSSLVATTADINGGTIDGTTIGGTTPAAGSFTQVNAGDGAEATPSITNTGDTNTGIYFPAADTIGVSTVGSERMRIDSAGNVGIGTTSITQAYSGYNQVNINGSNGATLQFQKSGTTYGNIINDSNAMYLQNSAAIAFGVGGTGTGTERMRIDGSGDVTMQGDLSVAGQIDAANLVGMIAPFAMSSAPSGWLVCDGSAISRTTYANLFTAISTTWGVGDGSTTFNLPDLRGEFLRGFDGGKGVDSARTFASFQEGSHHLINTGNQIFGIDSGGQRGDVPVTSSVSVRYNSSLNSASLSSSDSRFGMARPRNMAVQYCIKF